MMSFPITLATSVACSTVLAAVTVHLPVGKMLTKTLLSALVRQSLFTYTPRPWKRWTFMFLSAFGMMTLEMRSAVSGWLRSIRSSSMSTLKPLSLNPRSNTPRMLCFSRRTLSGASSASLCSTAGFAPAADLHSGSLFPSCAMMLRQLATILHTSRDMPPFLQPAVWRRPVLNTFTLTCSNPPGSDMLTKQQWSNLLAVVFILTGAFFFLRICPRRLSAHRTEVTCPSMGQRR
mmetsp:Transcript_13723/g.32624  ORF Transcript_13723/g.32624 Transcript_13723/m.32624 type:complete len:233 (+) Transcript_13723:101-799(+)